MKIKIKRATSTGLKDAEGLLIEHLGYQFCFIKCNEEDSFFLIELSSGGSAKTIDAELFTKKEALKIATESIKKRSLNEFDTAYNHFKQIYSEEFGYKFPINEPIKT